jgi:phosphomannomutase
MVKKFFGTDGIRGTVNSETLNSEIALKLGLAVYSTAYSICTKKFLNHNYSERVLGAL